MMPLQLYFPEGIPKSLDRIVNPDAITSALIDGLNNMERKLLPVSKSAVKLVHDKQPWWKRVFADPDVLDPEWLHWTLFSEDKWPSLSKESRFALRFLKRLMQLDSSLHKPYFPRGSEPTDKQIKASLAHLEKAAKSLGVPVYNAYIATLNDVGSKVAPLCSEYGEACSRDEAAAIVNSDLYAMKDLDRFPGVSPQMSRLLVAFLDYLDV